MLSFHFMEKKQQCNSFGFSGKLWCSVHEAFEPYRQAFIHGDIKQQSSIINDFVSSLIAAEKTKLVEERGHCMETSLPVEEIFTCKLCQELSHVPMTLVCGHTFCSECLENYKREGKTMCPGCGHESSLHYTSNIVVRKLSQMWLPEKTRIRSCIAEANKLLREQKVEEFMELTKNLLAKYPKNVDLLCLRASGYQRLDAHNDALNVLDFAYRLAPFCSKVLCARGEVFRSIDDTEEAMVMYLRASALKPNEPIYRERLTSCIEKHLRNTYNAYDAATVRRLSKSLPVESAPTFDEPNATRQCMSKKPACYSDASQIAHGNVPKTLNSNDHAIRTDRTDQKDDSAFRTDATEKPVNNLRDEDRSYNKTEATEKNSQCKKDGCIQRPITVDRPKSNIPDELECKLCFNIFYEPVTTPCGHSFCQPCLRRCLDHRFQCPCCRTNLHSYLEHMMKKDVGTCRVIESLCLLMFNDEYQVRKLAYEQDLSEFSRCENNNDVIPIFVCALAVPDIACPLHIFEPRYKLMIRKCMESGSRQFGMCVSDREETFAAVGTMLYINDVNYLPDGRSIVHTVGCRRFRVLERGTQNGYNTAKVAWIQDERDEGDYRELSSEVYNMMMQWLQKLPSEQRTCIVEAIGRLPETRQETDENGPSWLWWLLAAMPLNNDAKCIILSMSSIIERLNSAKRFLAILLKRL